MNRRIRMSEDNRNLQNQEIQTFSFSQSVHLKDNRKHQPAVSDVLSLLDKTDIY